MTPMEELQNLHKTFKFKNLNAVAQTLMLDGGDSVQIPPNATVSVPSKLVIQIPQPTIVKTIIPSHEDMLASGYIQMPVVEPAPVKKIEKD